MTTSTESAAANAWEETFIADLGANGGVPSGGPLAGRPHIVLHSTGRRTGEQRRAILAFSRDGKDLVVAGTAGGAPTDPNWIANLRANPTVTIELGADTFDATATIEDGAERDRLWDQHVAQQAHFADYPKQITARTIPMVRLARRAA